MSPQLLRPSGLASLWRARRAFGIGRESRRNRAPEELGWEEFSQRKGHGRMVQRNGYGLGELCWADVQTPDVGAAEAC